MGGVRMRPLWILAAVVVLVGAVVAGLAYGSLQPKLDQNAAAQSCSPKPCAAPNGFEIDISQIIDKTDPGPDGLHFVSMAVSFTNNTQPDAFEAVSYRHTSPQDFSLRLSDGRTLPAAFWSPQGPANPAPCTDWGELRVQRGQSSGPEHVCFELPHGAKFKEAKLIWSPDLGLMFRSVTIPLN